MAATPSYSDNANFFPSGYAQPFLGETFQIGPRRRRVMMKRYTVACRATLWLAMVRNIMFNLANRGVFKRATHAAAVFACWDIH
jgi:hypothetical protein